MRKETIIMTTDSRRAYVRPLITAVVPAPIVLQSASPEPEPPVVPVNPGVDGVGGALLKIGIFDLWQEEEDDEDEKTPIRAITFD